MASELRHTAINGERIAFRYRAGGPPTLMFLPGYASDMDGSKAVAVDAFAGARGLGCLRFDYSGTGSSGGDFDDGTLGSWLDEVIAMLDSIEGPIIPIGSSMGGWLALLAAVRRPGRVAALVGIAAAPDFTDWGYSDAEKAELQRNGRLEQPNPYSPDPHVTTLGFWQSGEALRILNEPISVDCPVRLIHGNADSEVPVAIALRTLEQLRSRDAQLTIVKGGGHRLSEPHEIEAILRAINELLHGAGGAKGADSA